ncbi:hypothetical protein F5B20DRAFT_249419 [Whalleya microplaca]|nr:hypothetical protein F5B20DRAFT_249419 [Whalleya microplaca]
MTASQRADSCPSDSPTSSTSQPGRNARRHSNETAAPLRVKRAQVARACHRCRKLQKACSDSRPCKRCSKAGLARECGGSPAKAQSQQSASTPIHSIITFPFAESPPFMSLDFPTTPPAFTSFARESFQRKADLLPPQVIDFCSGRFFDRLSPTIPILTPEYVAVLRSRPNASETGAEAYCVLVGMCAMVMLQVEDPNGRSLGNLVTAENNSAYGWLLLEEALAAHRHLTRTTNPSLDSILLAFFIYACHAKLFHHSQAFFFLREATTLCILIKIEDMDDLSRTLAERLFWVLLVSERSHAIRYRRPTTLQVTANSLWASSFGGDDTSLSGFWCLASLFRAFDTTFIALLNHESVSCPIPLDAFDDVEVAVNTALNHSCPTGLLPSQKANLRITQLWLRIVLWQLRLRLGHLSEQNAQSSRTYHYPLEVGKDLTLSTRDLPVHSIQLHGVGITEKLFDIACAMVNVLARVPVQITKTAAEEDLRYLRRLILQLPGGTTVYDALLTKHVQQTMPEMTLALEI